MSAGASLRRAGVFALLFGAAMAVVVWQSRGVEVPDDGRATDPVERARPPAEDVVPIDAGAAMGSGRGVRVTRDAVEVVDGKPVPYRAFEATWERQTPVPGGAAEERRLRTETFQALVFHRRPTPEDLRPPAVEGPDTTRLRAAEADLTMREGAAFRAQLVNDVEVIRHAEDEDLTLRTSALDIERASSARGAEELHATSDARVVIDGSGTHIEGTGMDADLGRTESPEGKPARVVLRREVSGSLVAPKGALLSQGGDASAESTPATFSCTGAAELVELSRASGRTGSTWRLTLEDDVMVEQDAVVMRCATLEVEFRRRDARGAAPGIDVLRVVADGGVVATGHDALTADTWTLRAPRTVTSRDDKGGYDVQLEGGTDLTFDGTLRGRGEKDEQRGHVRVRCSGPATLHTDPEPAHAGTPVRTRMTFRDDVVAEQWDADGALVTEIRAPTVTLAGDRGTSADGRIDPDTLTAQGTAEERVHVRREALTARADAVTWRVMREEDYERLLLEGRPSVSIQGGKGMNLLGTAAADADATLLLDAQDRVEVTWRHEPDPELALPPGTPHVTALARTDVVVRRLVAEREVYRLEAQALDATLDAELQPQLFRAYGNVVLTGSGERPGERYVELRGDRLAADRLDGDGTDWVRTDVLVFGQREALATALVREPAKDADARPAEHIVRAEQLRYEQGGTLITAKRNAEILLDGVAPGTRNERSDVHIRGRELRAYLRPPEDGSDGRPEVLRLEGDDGVTLETAAYRVQGTSMSYDRTTGIAIARGRPARGILRVDGVPDGDTEHQSFVSSDKEIRVEFDPTEETPGRPRRVTCEGGMLRFYQPASDEGSDGALERVTLRADGPIEVLGETASADGNVDAVWESERPGGTMQQDARLLCEHAELTFDVEAEGPARDRIRSAVAVGSRSRTARLTTPKLDATADRVESRGQWIELLAPWGRPVHVRQRDPEDSFTCDKGRYNYVTQEFKATRARAD